MTASPSAAIRAPADNSHTKSNHTPASSSPIAAQHPHATPDAPPIASMRRFKNRKVLSRDVVDMRVTACEENRCDQLPNIVATRGTLCNADCEFSDDRSDRPPYSSTDRPTADR
jgi:hypothetical protein